MGARAVRPQRPRRSRLHGRWREQHVQLRLPVLHRAVRVLHDDLDNVDDGQYHDHNELHDHHHDERNDYYDFDGNHHVDRNDNLHRNDDGDDDHGHHHDHDHH